MAVAFFTTGCATSGTTGTETTAPTAPSTAGRDKEADIIALLNVSGSTQVSDQILSNMLTNLKAMVPGPPDEFWDSIAAEVSGDEMNKMLIPIYDKHLSHADILSAIEYYRSPAGKRVVEALPAITEESMLVGQKWGEELGQKILIKLVNEGYLPPEALGGM